MVLIMDTVDKFASYSSYHRDPVNVFIHVVMVPLIVFSGMLMGLAYPYEGDLFRGILPPHFVLPHVITLALVVILFVFSYLLEPFAGFILNLEMIGMYYIGLYLLKQYGATDVFWIGLYMHIISWVAQFIGHGFFEGRRPALLSNITQTLVAPTFVILEVLFFFGYRPQLHKAVQKAQAKHLPKKAA